MLGKYVRVRITRPIHSKSDPLDDEYLLNYGVVEGGRRFAHGIDGAYVIGVDRPLRSFDGRVIAVVHTDDERVFLVVAPKHARFIETQIRETLAFVNLGDVWLDCLYERSCGAIVFRVIDGQVRYLLIKNKRSAHWGFPKGHMEGGETPEQTATREVFEETGIRIEIIPDFSLKSEYTIQGKVEKSVVIFMARTNDEQTVIQREEIDDYVWLSYGRALDLLKFENDRAILRKGHQFLRRNKMI